MCYNRSHPLTETFDFPHDLSEPPLEANVVLCCLERAPNSRATQKLICFIAISPGHYNIIISGD